VSSGDERSTYWFTLILIHSSTWKLYYVRLDVHEYPRRPGFIALCLYPYLLSPCVPQCYLLQVRDWRNVKPITGPGSSNVNGEFGRISKEWCNRTRGWPFASQGAVSWSLAKPTSNAVLRAEKMIMRIHGVIKCDYGYAHKACVSLTPSRNPMSLGSRDSTHAPLTSAHYAN
jgi:hypothetical protein